MFDAHHQFADTNSFFFLLLLLVSYRGPNWSWTHDLTLYLALISVQDASWARAHWYWYKLIPQQKNSNSNNHIDIVWKVLLTSMDQKREILREKLIICEKKDSELYTPFSKMDPVWSSISSRSMEHMNKLNNVHL